MKSKYFIAIIILIVFVLNNIFNSMILLYNDFNTPFNFLLPHLPFLLHFEDKRHLAPITLYQLQIRKQQNWKLHQRLSDACCESINFQTSNDPSSIRVGTKSHFT